MAVKYPFGETENLVTANVGTVGTYATLAGEYGNVVLSWEFLDA